MPMCDPYYHPHVEGPIQHLAAEALRKYSPVVPKEAAWNRSVKNLAVEVQFGENLQFLNNGRYPNSFLVLPQLD